MNKSKAWWTGRKRQDQWTCEAGHRGERGGKTLGAIDKWTREAFGNFLFSSWQGKTTSGLVDQGEGEG